MKDIYIADLKTNQEIITYFIVKTVAVKVGSNKKAYLDLLLADCTGEVTAIVVPGSSSIFACFKSGGDITIPWECIRKIGEEVILVEI